MHHFNMNKNNILILFVAAILTGCTHTVQLKVVDGTTGRPVSGVAVLWKEYSAYNLLTGKRKQAGPDNYFSNNDGLITVSNLHKKRVSYYTFSHQDHAILYGVSYPDSIRVSTQIKAPPISQDRFMLEGQREVIYPSNKIYVITLPKK